MKFYTFHIGDYRQDTDFLEWDEDLIYRRLLDLYYQNDGPLPNDINKIARKIRATNKIEKVQSVLDDFFVLQDDGWHQSRCDEEIALVQQKSEKAKKSATTRWSKDCNANAPHTESDSDANAMRTQCERYANQ